MKQFAGRSLERVRGWFAGVVMASTVATGCGGAVDGENVEGGEAAGESEIATVSQALQWGASSGLLADHRAWHQGGRSPTNQGIDFLRFHREILARMAAEHRALGRNPSETQPWTSVPSALKNSSLGWNSTLAAAEQRIITNNPPFANENEFGTFVEFNLHAYLHNAGATAFNEPVLASLNSPNSTYFFQLHGLIDLWWSRFIGRSQLHTATSSNIVGHWTVLNHTFLNNRPYARLLVTQNWRSSGPYNNHNIGVWYNSGTGRWNIYNEDFAAMPVNAKFNVQIEGGLGVETAYNSNKAFNYMWFVHPQSSGNSSRRVWATHVFNPLQVPGTYNDSPAGVWYTGSDWSVFNQDSSFTMQNNVSFYTAVTTVADAARNDSTFTHTATSSNISGNTTALSHSSINNNPNARLIVMPNWGTSGPYNNHPIGVWYNTGTQRWGIFNQDLATMPTNARFNVIIQR